jgi:hypothetical protein
MRIIFEQIIITIFKIKFEMKEVRLSRFGDNYNYENERFGPEIFLKIIDKNRHCKQILY